MASTTWHRGLVLFGLLAVPWNVVAQNLPAPTSMGATVDTVNLNAHIAQVSTLFHDGTYGYVVPYDGDITRFSLASFDSASFASLSTGSNYYYSGFAHGGYGYLFPQFEDYVGRFSLATFSGLETTTFAPAFVGGFHDGTWCYLPPADEEVIFTRFSLADWDTYEEVDIGSGNAMVWSRGFADTANQHVYLFSAIDVLVDFPEGGTKLIRLSTGAGSFDTSTMDTWDISVTGDAGFISGFVHDDSVYLVPFHTSGGSGHGRLMRFGVSDWKDNSKVEVWDLKQAASHFWGFGSSWSDGTYGYMLPQRGNPDLWMARFLLSDPTQTQEEDLSNIGISGTVYSYHDGFTVGGCTYLVSQSFTTMVRVSLGACGSQVDTSTMPGHAAAEETTTKTALPTETATSTTTDTTVTDTATATGTTVTDTTTTTGTTVTVTTTTVTTTTTATTTTSTTTGTTVTATSTTTGTTITGTTTSTGTTVTGTTTGTSTETPTTSSTETFTTTETATTSSTRTSSSTSTATSTSTSSGTTATTTTTASSTVTSTTTVSTAATATATTTATTATTTATATTTTTAATTRTATPTATAATPTTAAAEEPSTARPDPREPTTAEGPAGRLPSGTAVPGTSPEPQLAAASAVAAASSTVGARDAVASGTQAPVRTTVSTTAVGASASSSEAGVGVSGAAVITGRSTGTVTTVTAGHTHLRKPGAIVHATSTASTTADVSTGGVDSSNEASRTATMTTSTTRPSSTITAPEAANAAEALIAAETKFSGKLVAKLSSLGENVTMSALPSGGSILAHRAGPAFAVHRSDGRARQHIAVPGSDVEVLVPASAFSHLGVDEDVAMVVTVFDSSNPSYAGLRSDVAREVVGAAVFSFRTLADVQLDVSGLPEPIKFSLPANYSSGLTCAYWDESAGLWSFDGVTTTSDNVAGMPLLCETTHLSLFGAIAEGIVQTLACANVAGLMNAEAFASIFQGQWYIGKGALIFAFVLAVVASSMAFAAFLDAKRRKHFDWQDEFFLMRIDPPPEEPRDEEEAVVGRRSTLSAGNVKKAGATICCCACCDSLQEHTGSVLKEALDDIASSWFEYFSEVRTLLEEFLGCLSSEAESAGTGLVAGKVCSRFCAISHRATSGMMIFTSRRATAASLGLSEDIIRFVVEDRDLVTFLMEELLKERIAERTAPPDEFGVRPSTFSGRSSIRGEWRTTPDQREAWNHLRGEISDHLFLQLKEQGERPNLLKTVAMIFACQNPVGALFVYDIFMNSKQRVVNLAVELLGSFAFCCVFFESTGLVKGKRHMEGCGDSSSSIGKSLGRFIVISLSSLFIAGLPVAILNSFQTKKFMKMQCARGSPAWRRQLRKWVIQERLYWGFGSIYICLCCLYIVLFLSNIGETDQDDWSFAGILTLLQDLLMLPFLSAFMVPVITRTLLCSHVNLTTTGQEEFVRHATLTLQRRVMLPIEAI